MNETRDLTAADPADEPLTELHDLTWTSPATEPVLARVTLRARTLRRRRRGLLVGGPVVAGTAAVLLIGTGFGAAPGTWSQAGRDGSGSPGPHAGTATVIPAPGPASGSPRPDGTAALPAPEVSLPLDQGRDLLYLADPRYGTVDTIDLSQDAPGVERVPTAPGRTAALAVRTTVRTGQEGKVLDAVLAVFGPGDKDPLGELVQVDDLNPGTVTVRGTTGRVLDGLPGTGRHDQTHQVTWRDPASGTWWAAESSGLTTAQLVTAVNGLRIDGPTVDPASLPNGLTPVPPAPSRARGTVTWSAAYVRSPTIDAVGSVWTVSVTRGGNGRDPIVLAATVSPQRTRVIDLGGVVGYLVEDDIPTLLWTRNGLSFTVDGLPADRAIAVARSLVHVAPDDPRLARAGRVETPSAQP